MHFNSILIRFLCIIIGLFFCFNYNSRGKVATYSQGGKQFGDVDLSFQSTGEGEDGEEPEPGRGSSESLQDCTRKQPQEGVE